MHRILPNYNAFNPELTYELEDAIQDTVNRLNSDTKIFDITDFEAVVYMRFGKMCKKLGYKHEGSGLNREALLFREFVFKAIDTTMVLAFTPQKIKIIQSTAKAELPRLQNELKSYGEGPYPEAIEKDVTRLKYKCRIAKGLIANCKRLLHFDSLK